MLVSRLTGTWIRSSPIAHRGLHNHSDGRPENSLAAFEYACEKSIPIELDVQLTADGDAAVIHDSELTRLTGSSGTVQTTSSRELSQRRLLSTDQTIPMLADVLKAVNARVPILIEIKNEGTTVGMLEGRVLEVLEHYAGPIAIQSFNPFSLQYIRRKAPLFDRGQLSGTFHGQEMSLARKILLRYMLFNVLSRPSFISYEVEGISSPILNLYRFLQVPILAWTVRSLEDRQRVLKDADNIIFEGFLP